MERGNLQSATFLINGKEEKIFLTPNVEYKALNAFDDKMQKVSLNELLQNEKQGQSVKPDTEQTVAEKQSAKKENQISDDKEKPTQKKLNDKK